MKTIRIACDTKDSVPLSKLDPYQGDLKSLSEQDYKKLKQSIIKTGFAFPVHAWKAPDGSIKILGGHQRVRCLTTLEAEGYTIPDVPVVFIDAENEKEAKRRVLQDVAQFGKVERQGLYEFMVDAGIDIDELTADFKIPEFEMDMDGFKTEFFDDNTIPPGDEDAVPSEPETPVTKIGDIYQLGNHRLMCGDCTSIDAVEKLMNGEKADMVFTDPPYNQETNGGSKGMFAKALRKHSSKIEHMCDFDPNQFLQTLPTVFEKNKMNALVFCNKDLVVDYLSYAKESGYSYNILFWKKPTSIPIGGSYRPDVEYLLVFRKSGIFNGGDSSLSYSKCLEFSREKEKVHPTMKPVEMIENQIQICSNKNSNVMDFFGGSGSTLIACEKTDRKCFMMEISESYCDVIIKRFEQYSGKKAVLINGLNQDGKAS